MMKSESTAIEMKDILETYKGLVDRFEEIIYGNIAIKLAAFKGFNESLRTDYEKTLKSFPLLFFIVESLQIDSVLTLNKIVEERGERTIQHLLKYASNNFEVLKTAFPKLTHDVLKDNFEELEKLKEHVRRIKTQRDKYYAHSDKEYFLKPGNVLRDFPQTYDDLVTISISVQDIITKHRQIVYGNMRVCVSDFVYLSAFRTIDLLKTASEEWYKKYRPDEVF